MVVIDENGLVVDVRPREDLPDTPEAQDAAKCVREVLDGLEFPCLAGLEICPAYVIIE
ncbi:MAG: hypothetical protein GY847_36045 [Proteobacteria bacterium]|nr:hypothetical protein [Pseudomonadota bacterium]